MTYRERNFLVPQPSQEQRLYSQKRLYNNHDNLWYPSHLSPTQPLRVVCKTEERHFVGNTSPNFDINSSLKPIQFTMNDRLQPVQFRSEIVVHTDPNTDIHIQKLRVAFNYSGEPSPNSSCNHHSTSSPRASSRRYSLDRRESSPSPRQQQSPHKLDSKRKVSTSRHILHQWIDDLCENEDLMSNENIVFFIKNGEFFVRI